MLELEKISCIRGEGTNAFTMSLEELSVVQGETLVITGPSGSGKSTLLEALALVLRPTHSKRFLWTIRRENQGCYDIKRLWQKNETAQLAALRARRIGFVLQTGGLLPFLNVAENVRIWRRIAARPVCTEKILQLMDRLEITELADKMPHQLSVGERQRVSIARALAHEPDLLLADEPTAALDPVLAEQVFRLMLDLVNQTGSTAIIVSHDYSNIREKAIRLIRAVPFETDAGRGSCFEEFS